ASAPATRWRTSSTVFSSPLAYFSSSTSRLTCCGGRERRVSLRFIGITSAACGAPSSGKYETIIILRKAPLRPPLHPAPACTTLPVQGSLARHSDCVGLIAAAYVGPRPPVSCPILALRPEVRGALLLPGCNRRAFDPRPKMAARSILYVCSVAEQPLEIGRA